MNQDTAESVFVVLFLSCLLFGGAALFAAMLDSAAGRLALAWLVAHVAHLAACCFVLLLGSVAWWWSFCNQKAPPRDKLRKLDR